MNPHQYIERETGRVITEQLIGDRSIHLIYNKMREHSPAMFNALTSKRMSSLLGFVHFDMHLDRPRKKGADLCTKMGINTSECIDPPHLLNTPRKIFERKIKYWNCRPLSCRQEDVASPADSKMLIGSFAKQSKLFIKEKFFSASDLFGNVFKWINRFSDGDYAVFRLTPDKYHYNHAPVSGKIIDIYEIDGQYHSCNPNAIIALASLYAKNKRVVTIIDTDTENGSNIGLVAMIEVVALMIGGISQCYSSFKYDAPQILKKGMFIEKGCPKSLYHPGSSTDILIFEKNKITFSQDICQNLLRKDVKSRFSSGFFHPLVETDVKVRSTIANSLQSTSHLTC